MSTLRRAWNGIRWGTPGGPGELDGPHWFLESGGIAFRNMSDRAVRKFSRFYRYGMSEGGDNMGKHEKPGEPKPAPPSPPPPKHGDNDKAK